MNGMPEFEGHFLWSLRLSPTLLGIGRRGGQKTLFQPLHKLIPDHPVGHQPLLALLAYNYLRFGNPLESGYSMASLGSDVLMQARSQGLFSVVHIPKNLFMMLLQLFGSRRD